MPDSKKIVINTSPILALIAALGDLSRLQSLYQEVLVPLEVRKEILKGGVNNFGVEEFQSATWISQVKESTTVQPFLLNSLDLGEASVIQVALNHSIRTVCIDEAVGRKVARLSGLEVTGSLGILLKAKGKDPSLSIREAIDNMTNRNIRLSKTVIDFAVQQAGEDTNK